MANFEAVHRYLATVEEAEKHPYKPCFTVSTMSVILCYLIDVHTGGFRYVQESLKHTYET